MNGYTLIRNWYAFKFDNPSKCKAIHSDMYCYLVDLWNRLGQKDEFGLPTQMTMEVLGIGSYNTYKKALDSLIEFGFVIIVSDSINQHQSKVVALSNFDKATDKALDKATIKATDEALDTINKPINQGTKKPIIDKPIPTFEEFKKYAIEKKPKVNLQDVRLKYDSWKTNDWKNGNDKKIKNWKVTLLNTLPYIKDNPHQSIHSNKQTPIIK